ncbi:MAG TPA: UrcA family protein [Caulobacteraceae bacterium]|nr:UrcA family protein [Caulobacteraceae bacterium]
MLTSAALAQPAPAAPGSAAAVTESLTVIAPKVVRRETPGATQFVGAPIEVLSLSRAVNFGDLDLTKQAGVDEFRRRIMYASLAACDAIEAEYPSNIYVPVPAAQNCPDRTATQAFVLADEIVAAARARAH